MHISPEFTIEIGSAVFGVKATYDGVEGIYLITMPMTTEQSVIGGRETFGEPKKLAQISLERDGDDLVGTVARMGVTIIELRGTVTAEVDPPARDRLAPRVFRDRGGDQVGKVFLCVS